MRSVPSHTALFSPYPLIITLVLAISMPAKAQYEKLLHKTYAERFPLLLDTYEGELENGDSTTIFNKIANIRQLAIDNHDDDLLLESAFLKAHYYYFRAKDNPQMVLNLLDSLKTESIIQHRLWGEIMAENMMALFNFKMLHNYGLAFEHHQRVYNLLKNVSSEEFPHKQSSLYQMADEHYFFGDYREAIFYLREALKAEPRQHIQKYYLSIPNTLGLCYRKLNDYDSSTYYFQQCYQKSLQTKDRAWEGISSGNIGINYYLLGQNTQAKPLLEKDYGIALEMGDTGAAASSIMVLAKIALAEKNYNLAKEYIVRAREYVYISRQYARLETLYTLLSKLYAIQGNADSSMIFLDSALYVKDSLARQFNTLQMTRAKQKVELEQHKAEIENIWSEKEAKTFERNALLALVAMLFVTALLSFMIYGSRNRRKQEEAAVNLREAEQQLLFARQKLEDFTKNVSEKNHFLEMFHSRMDDSTQNTWEELQKSIILTEEDWINFKSLFGQVHPRFFSTLAYKYPDISPAEIRFLALCKLNISTKEMAAMLGISIDAIRKQRHRLRKKLEISHPGVELEDFVAQL